jgi:hypothetical protein
LLQSSSIATPVTAIFAARPAAPVTTLDVFALTVVSLLVDKLDCVDFAAVVIAALLDELYCLTVVAAALLDELYTFVVNVVNGVRNVEGCCEADVTDVTH